MPLYQRCFVLITSDRNPSKELMRFPAFFNTAHWTSQKPFSMAAGHHYQEAEMSRVAAQIVPRTTPGGAAYPEIS